MLSMRKNYRFFLALALMTIWLLVLTSCSKLNFIYNRMDWLIPHFIDDYVELSAPQEKILGQKVTEFIHWHCSEEIPQYIDLVRQWRQLADNGKLERAQYVAQRELVLARFHHLATKSADEMKPLVQGMNEQQLRQFIEKIKEENQQLKEDFIDEDFDEIQSKLESRLITRYERWVGSLTDEQLSWVRETSFKLIDFEKARFQYRSNWLRLLEQVWEKDKNMDSVADFLYYTATDRERFWSNEYRLKYFDRSKENELLTLKIMNSLSNKQLKKLKQELADLEAQLVKMSCH